MNRTYGSQQNSTTKLSPIDLLLGGTASAVAVYAGAISLSSPKNAQFFLLLVLAGTVVSAGAVRLLGSTKLVTLDATLYTGIALVAFLGIRGLNAIVPDSIFTGPLTMAGILSWMLVLGSAAVWRDQTMLFQAVPAVALFGLVGCYDTFRGSVAYFFVFLVCEATLLARAHGRAMLRQAQASYDLRVDFNEMRRGPWRSMAGPEWALGSALVIVLFSAIGAPIIRQSTQGFSGLVQYAPPLSPLSTPSLSTMSRTGLTIGQGPNHLSDVPVLRLTMRNPGYLRGLVCDSYRDGAWFPRTSTVDPGVVAAQERAYILDAIKGRNRLIAFRIEPLILYNAVVPVPGEVISLAGNAPNDFSRNISGTFTTRSEPPYPILEGESEVFNGHAQLEETDPGIAKFYPAYLNTSTIPKEVVDLARQCTRGVGVDFEKALAIKAEIETRAKYNLDAPKTPTGEDPVSYFLFKSKQGYCDVFASSMTLMARSVGLPARYVTGYYPFDLQKDDGGRFIVRQRDMHAWCEIFFKDAGWVVFDATEGAQVIGDGRGAATDDPFWRSNWFLSLAALGGLGLLGYATRVAFRWTRYAITHRAANRAKRLASRNIAFATKLYRSYERELRHAAGRPRRPGETLFEFTRAAEANLGARASFAWSTSQAFSAILYAVPQLERRLLFDLARQVKEFRRS